MRASLLMSLRRVIQSEADALRELVSNLDDSVVSAVECLYSAKGRIVTTGVGKSASVAQKFAATLSSTGSPAFFLNPTDAMHGDLGVFLEGDICVAFSSSGETRELLDVLPVIRSIGVFTISITSREESSLGRHAHLSLSTRITREADRFNLIPTCTTIAMHALCDSLAVAVMELRNFSKEAYARLHPAGTIGKKLCLRVSDCMHTDKRIPMVCETQSVAEAVFEITRKRLGATLVLGSNGKLVGIFTDGDLRRLIQATAKPLELRVSEVMSQSPVTALESDLAVAAAQEMQVRRIAVLPVLATITDRRPVGIVHLHDLVAAGLIESQPG